MLFALTHRKLRPEAERMEDVLTGTILGAMAYLPTAVGWGPMLAQAKPHVVGRPPPIPPDDVAVEATFWPNWPHGDGRFTEPDVVLRWPGAVVVVEVKYLSGKSSEADEDVAHVTDQLARQLVLLRDVAADEGRAQWGVVYLTADVQRPAAAMTASVAEVRAKRGEDVSGRLSWTRWRDAHDVLAAVTDVAPGQRALARDAAAHLATLGFAGFRGVRARPVPWDGWHAGFALASASGRRPVSRRGASWNWTNPARAAGWQWRPRG